MACQLNPGIFLFKILYKWGPMDHTSDLLPPWIDLQSHMKNFINNVNTTTFIYEPENLVHMHNWSLAFTPGFSSSLLSILFLPRRNISLITDDGFSRLKQLLNNVMMIKKHPVFQLTKCNIVKMFHRKKNTCSIRVQKMSNISYQIISYLRHKVQTFYVCVSQLERFHTDRANVNELRLKITSHYHKSAFNI